MTAARDQWRAPFVAFVALLLFVAGFVVVGSLGDDDATTLAAARAADRTAPAAPDHADHASGTHDDGSGAHDDHATGAHDDHATGAHDDHATGAHDDHATGNHADEGHNDAEHGTNDDHAGSSPHDHGASGAAPHDHGSGGTTPTTHGSHDHGSTGGSTTPTTGGHGGHDHGTGDTGDTGGTTPTTVPHDHDDGHDDDGHDDDGHDHGGEYQVQIDELPEVVQAQIVKWTQWAMQYDTTAKATAGGYPQLTAYFPGIAAHYVNLGLLFDYQPFSPDDPPEVLLFNGTGPDAQLVGLNWIVYTGATPPEGFEGPYDVWHAHPRLCLSGGLVVGEVPAGTPCPAGQTAFDFDGFWLLHVWSIPGWESPEGIFSHENSRV